MENENANTMIPNADFDALMAEKEKEFSALIDKWIADGPTHKREKLMYLAKRLLDAESITEDEYGLLMECTTFVPKAGDGSINLSFSLEPAERDPEYKSYAAKIMAMMSFFGHVE